MIPHEETLLRYPMKYNQTKYLIALTLIAAVFLMSTNRGQEAAVTNKSAARASAPGGFAG